MKISLVIITYNAQKYIEETLMDAFAQTFNDYEIILVDDRSRDATVSVSRNYYKEKIKENPELKRVPFRIIEHDLNLGEGYSRATGVKSAIGDFITVIDGDDRLNSTYLETLWRATDFGKRDIGMCDFQIKTKDVITGGEYRKDLKFSNTSELCQAFLLRQEQMGGIFWTLWCKLIRSNILKHCDWDNTRDIVCGQDSVILAEVMTKCKTGAIVASVEYFWIQRSTSTSHNLEKRSAETESYRVAYRIIRESNVLPDEDYISYKLRNLLNVSITAISTQNKYAFQMVKRLILDDNCTTVMIKNTLSVKQRILFRISLFNWGTTLLLVRILLNVKELLRSAISK